MMRTITAIALLLIFSLVNICGVQNVLAEEIDSEIQDVPSPKILTPIWDIKLPEKWRTRVTASDPNTEDKEGMFFITNVGDVWVLCNHTVCVFDKHNGDLQWSRKGLRKLYPREMSNATYAVARRYKWKDSDFKGKTTVLVNSMTGELELGTHQYISKDDDFITFEYLPRYNKMLLTSYIFKKGKALFSKVECIDMNTKNSLWVQTEEAGIAWGQWLLYTGESVLKYNHNNLYDLDLTTGEILKSTDISFGDSAEIKIKLHTIDHEKKVAYLSKGNFIFALDLSTGLQLWSNKSLIGLECKKILMTPQGLIVELFDLSLLDPVTGKIKWTYDLPTFNLGIMDVDTSQIILLTLSGLVSISLEDGESKLVCKSFTIAEKEYPKSVEIIEEGYLLSSANSATLIDRNGVEIYHYYTKPHQGGGLKKFLQVIGSVAMLAVASLDPAGSYDALVASETGGLVDFALNSPQLKLLERKNSNRLKDYLLMYVNVENENGKGTKIGLGMLKKKTGIIEKQIRLGGYKKDFRIDLYEGKLYHLKGKKRLLAYDLTQ